MPLPKVIITMGDPSGIGAEIIVKALARSDVYDICRPIVIGDASRLIKARTIVGFAPNIHSVDDIDTVDETNINPDNIQCIDLKMIEADYPFGEVSAKSGEAAYQYIKKAAEIVSLGKAQAICTAPICKEALHAAGHKFPGHTELLAHLTGTDEVSMMLVSPKLRVIHVTTHLGLIDAINKIEPKLVERVITRGYDLLRKRGIENPRIAVCAINPHAGENGLFGYGEEEEKIIPAVKACQAKGWDIIGPLSSDTLFYLAQKGAYDMVVAMYHDQGHIPVKVLGLEDGVNITVGLPVIRTSVDHGTAFDIAGSGKADEQSLVEALKQAADLSERA